jgi:hypothetical protein
MAKRFLASYGTHSFVTTFKTARHWFCPEQVNLFKIPQFQPTNAHNLTIMNGMDDITKVSLFQNPPPPPPTQAVSVVSFLLSLLLTNRHFTLHMLSNIVYLALLTQNVQFIGRVF